MNTVGVHISLDPNTTTYIMISLRFLPNFSIYPNDPNFSGYIIHALEKGLMAGSVLFCLKMHKGMTRPFFRALYWKSNEWKDWEDTYYSCRPIKNKIKNQKYFSLRTGGSKKVIDSSIEVEYRSKPEEIPYILLDKMRSSGT